jgi:thioesterase domain-containing protein
MKTRAEDKKMNAVLPPALIPGASCGDCFTIRGEGGLARPRDARIVAAMSQNVPDHLGPAALEAFLHEKIPLTRAMGLRVAASDARRLALEAPLAANVNHLGTAFGGSLHALPTLACYAALWTILREAGLDGHVVVKRSTAAYRSPVTGTLRAVCERPPAEACAAFLSDLRRHKKARMELTAIVEGAVGKPAVEFSGSFVAVM